MAKIKFSGPFRHRVSSFLALNRIAIATYARHAFGRRMEPRWGAEMEIGIRFVRHQFTIAMNHPDFAVGRQIFDSVQTETDEVYPVDIINTDTPNGDWHHPETINSDATLLYLHGGGYAFHAGVSRRFASMLAHRTGAQVFAPEYRLTPEHPHPAQAEDALAAWHHVTQHTSPEKIVVIGDSAGGHMALMLLQTLKEKGLPQPGLCIGLCPWTDVGARGDSLSGNDPYDLVQGWMALRFGDWLDPNGTYGRTELSPIEYDFSGLAPLYLQVGGREVLRDMILDFADVVAKQDTQITLDLWDDMPHVFQAYDTWTQSSHEAIARICAAVEAHTSNGPPLHHVAGTTQVHTRDEDGQSVT